MNFSKKNFKNIGAENLILGIIIIFIVEHNIINVE